MNALVPINQAAFYRAPENRDEFFERVMRDAGRPPFVKPPGRPRLSTRPRCHQQPINFPGAVIRVPSEATKADQ